MKGGVLQRIQGRIKIVTVLGFVGLVSLSTTLQNNTTKVKDITSLQEGMQTCFTRVHNTLTARLMGSLESKYLSKGFTSLTEECFGETVSYYEALNVGALAALDDLNTLANDIHWFHEKASNSISGSSLTGENPENVLISLITGRYEKLESRRDSVIEKLNNEKRAIVKGQSDLKNIFYVLVGLLPLLILLDFISTRSKQQMVSEIEKEGEILLQNENVSIETVMPLVKRVLSGINGPNLTKSIEILLAKVKAERRLSPLARPAEKEVTQQSIEEEVSNTSSTKNEIPAKGHFLLSEQQIEKLWKENEDLTDAALDDDYATPGDVVSAEAVLGSVVDLVSSKIFTMGINLDIDSEAVYVKAEREALEQVFYHVLMNSISSYSHDDPNKYLSITMRKLGGTLLIDFFDSGREFGKEFLKHAAGLGTSSAAQSDLSVALGLIDDVDGKLSFENVASEDGSRVIGRKVQVVLNVFTANTGKRVTKVEKGTKKEILAKMRRSR